jgi:hypothetical protein
VELRIIPYGNARIHLDGSLTCQVMMLILFLKKTKMDTNIKNNYFLSHSHLSNSKCRFLLIRKMLQKTYQNWVSSNVLNCNLACDLALLQLDTLSDPENPVLAFT